MLIFASFFLEPIIMGDVARKSTFKYTKKMFSYLSTTELEHCIYGKICLKGIKLCFLGFSEHRSAQKYDKSIKVCEKELIGQNDIQSGQING
ncbi:hypothetical protein TTHERM_000013669 (macronuclear) [Tetrahymena thermophila SB210]|uniref:Uncharacterized protein n=1 Tax=Tetrahymena thermophila (strain SB210) TaxID=312017 RepID=W7XGZ6_TETTS|nr:hypothetical protein TTHERM_000013669 [Tetrahymena thermophila SB210]EWS76358.1 hypothetical protein TTHERM_000013669 [Tetrahymena thermophila SB210]|eukprot:XP_012651142.1 hypothetical protein TTHERM_000013669 [Tetrahymena thermophila SB210]